MTKDDDKRKETLEGISELITHPQVMELMSQCINAKGYMRAEGVNLLDEIQFDHSKRKEYHEILKLIKENEQGLQKMGLKDILDYSIIFAGYNDDLGVYPYSEVLLTIASMVGVNNTLIETPKKKLMSRINVANAGDQNAGKSFCNRDFLLGNEELQIPPHGIPFIRDGIEDITGPSFIWRSFIEERSEFRYQYLNDEYKRWYQHSIELRDLQKRIFESKPIRWALKGGLSVPSYRFKGGFILNFNLNYTRNEGILSVDPDLRAILSRLILRSHEYNDKIHDFYQSRSIIINPEEARKIRLFLNYLYEITRKNNGFSRYPKPVVRWNTESYEKIMQVSKVYINFLKEVGNLNSLKLNFGTRQMDNTIKIISNLSILDYFKQYLNSENQVEGQDVFYMKPTDLALDIGINYLIDELIIRQPSPFTKNDEKKAVQVPFGKLFKQFHKLNIQRWDKIIPTRFF